MAASNIPGIDVEDVVIHASGGKMQLQIDWQDDKPASASVVYRCPWASAIPLARKLRGGYPEGGEGLIPPSAPHAFPLIPELYCHGVSIRPKDDEIRKGDLSGDGENWVFNAHPHALITASYKAPDWAFDAAQAAQYPASQIDPGNPIVGCRQRVRASTAYLAFEGALLTFYDPPGRVIESTDGIPANQVEFVLEYPRLRVDPTLFLSNFKGRLNHKPIFGLAAEKVLFDSFEVDRTLTLGAVEVGATLTLIGNLDMTWNQRLDDLGNPHKAGFITTTPGVFKKPHATTNLHAMLGIPEPLDD